MSVNSMTNAAIGRRRDFPPVNGVPRGLAGIADAAAGETTSQNPVTAALGVIATYIPTETLALYVAVLAAIGVSETTSNSTVWRIFWIFFIGTPVVVWLVYAAKVRDGFSHSLGHIDRAGPLGTGVPAPS